MFGPVNPIPPEELCKIGQLAKKLLSKEVVFFIGAGCSRSSSIPSADECSKLLCNKVLQRQDSGDVEILLKLGVDVGSETGDTEDARYAELGDLAEEFWTKYQSWDKFHEYLEVESWKEKKPSKSHFVLAELLLEGCYQDIFTTNIDLLIEKAYEVRRWPGDSGLVKITQPSDYEAEGAVGYGANRLFKLHGSLDDKDLNQIRWSESQLKRQSWEDRRKVCRNALGDRAAGCTVVFVGFSSDVGYINASLKEVSPGLQSLNRCLVDPSGTEALKDKAKDLFSITCGLGDAEGHIQLGAETFFGVAKELYCVALIDEMFTKSVKESLGEFLQDTDIEKKEFATLLEATKSEINDLGSANLQRVARSWLLELPLDDRYMSLRDNSPHLAKCIREMILLRAGLDVDSFYIQVETALAHIYADIAGKPTWVFLVSGRGKKYAASCQREFVRCMYGEKSIAESARRLSLKADIVCYIVDAQDEKLLELSDIVSSVAGELRNTNVIDRLPEMSFRNHNSLADKRIGIDFQTFRNVVTEHLLG